MKKTFSALFATLLFLSGALFAAETPKVKKQLPFSKGINLPVWMEYGRFNTLLYGKKDFENIKSLGVEAVRVPVWFDVWADKNNDYKLDPGCFEILDRAVNWCEQMGMYIIIDFHNDCSGASQTNPRIENVLLKIWPQIAEHYKKKSSFVIYEIMNEPHFESGNTQADISKWGKVQGKVLDAIRAVDKKHSIIVGGGYWDSLDSMLKLPFYKDDNLIYNFHDYTPFLFTHQGTSWTFSKRITNVPFPYVKEKMPPLPPNATDAEKWEINTYQEASSEKNLSAPLNKAVEFANKRNAALMCNEFGVLMTFAEPSERANWYRMKCKWMDERNIARLSWDYTQEFGLYNSPQESRFPDDLNRSVIEAMGYKYPSDAKSETWFSRANKTGDYTIYKDGTADLIRVQSWSASGSLAATEAGSDEKFINLKDLKPYDELLFQFKEACDFTSLVEQNAKLEFYVKSSDKKFDITVYFRDMEAKIFPWRASTLVTTDNVKPDGTWRKVSIPLKKLNDVGGWTAQTNWRVSEGKFSWALVDALVIQNNNHRSQEGYAIKDIKIVY
jgi:endoglucanase